MIAYAASQFAGREELYRSGIRDHIKGHTEALDNLAAELSETRDPRSGRARSCLSCPTSTRRSHRSLISWGNAMTENAVTRLLPDRSPDGGMKLVGYISDDAVADSIANECGRIFFTNATGNANVGVWQCTPCTEVARGYPFDQCCFVLDGTMTMTDQRGHAETHAASDAFVIPRGFNGSFKMTGNFRNCFMTVEPER